MNKLLTISVADYNLGNMIEKNIESFLSCKNREKLEVLIINDGSIDDTIKIVEKYQQKYPSIIKLINKKNEGAGSTVNEGIKNANGKYFRIVDGDDWVDTEKLDILLNSMEQLDVDMIINDYSIFNAYQGKITNSFSVQGLKKKNTIITFNDVASNFSLVMHQVIFKTEILKKNNIRLDKGYYTDIEYLLFPMPYISKFIYIDLNIYIYLVERDGQSMNISSLQKHLTEHNIVLSSLVQFYEKNKADLDGKKKKFIISKISSIATNQLQTILTFNDENKKREKIIELNTYLKTNSSDIYKKYKRNSKKAFIITTFGIKTLGLIGKIYKYKG